LAEIIDLLFCKCEALSLNLNLAKKIKKRKKQMMLGKLYIHMQKNELRLLPQPYIKNKKDWYPTYIKSSYT
jgi:hypothetical protein